MAGHLRLLPRRERGIDIPQCLLGLALKPGTASGDRCTGLPIGERPEFGDLRLEFRNRLFEIEIGAHGPLWVSSRKGTGKRRKLAM